MSDLCFNPIQTGGGHVLISKSRYSPIICMIAIKSDNVSSHLLENKNITKFCS